jgi:hypothetical protein
VSLVFCAFFFQFRSIFVRIFNVKGLNIFNSRILGQVTTEVNESELCHRGTSSTHSSILYIYILWQHSIRRNRIQSVHEKHGIIENFISSFDSSNTKHGRSQHGRGVLADDAKSYMSGSGWHVAVVSRIRTLWQPACQPRGDNWQRCSNAVRQSGPSGVVPLGLHLHVIRSVYSWRNGVVPLGLHLHLLEFLVGVVELYQ